jgi:UBX domain-containing protein 1
MRYDDPENSRILNEINSGRAPPSILNVAPGQPVELRVARRLDENYVPPAAAPAAAFSGSGHRLGGVVPDILGTGHTDPTTAMPGALGTGPAGANNAGPSGSTAAAANPRFEVDQSQPTTSVQIRLADGTRLVCRMNLTHKVGDIRNFINAARPENLAREYTIGTTFPNKTLDNDALTVEEAGLKNAVVVQRWV